MAGHVVQRAPGNRHNVRLGSVGTRALGVSSREGDLGRLSKRLKPVLPDPALPPVGIYPADVFTQATRSICTAYSFKPGRN